VRAANSLKARAGNILKVDDAGVRLVGISSGREGWIARDSGYNPPLLVRDDVAKIGDRTRTNVIEEATKTNELTISIIIPARDEEASICALLERLLRQTRRAEEIIVTDGGSRDRTPEIIEEFAQRAGPVRLIRAGAALPGRGRNLAAGRATSGWLAFVDAGTLPASDWLELLAAEVERDPSVDVVFGAWKPRVESFFEECAGVAYAYESPVEFAGVKISPPCVGSSMVRREVWQRVGGFAEDLRAGEDILFMDKISDGQFRTAYAPRAVVAWEMPPTLLATFTRFRVYSRHNLRAGLWRRWHAAIITRYVLVALVALSSVALGARMIAVAFALWLLMLTARAAAASYRKRGVFKTTLMRGALRFIALVPIIAVIDAATLVGALHWLVVDRRMKIER
jgi:cellulose synthase/poly-beta-1,6-N-acetylglucosamine synthase-like glycosyltransferase